MIYFLTGYVKALYKQVLSIVCTDGETEAWGDKVTGPRLQNELLTTPEIEDFLNSHIRYVWALAFKASLMLFSFSPVLWGLASEGERVVQVSWLVQPFVSVEASSKLTSYCQK